MPPFSLTPCLAAPPRAGSPQEEASLAQHLLGLCPPGHALEEGCQLAELLVVLGHEGDARMLQAQLAAWVAQHKVGWG